MERGGLVGQSRPLGYQVTLPTCIVLNSRVEEAVHTYEHGTETCSSWCRKNRFFEFVARSSNLGVDFLQP